FGDNSKQPLGVGQGRWLPMKLELGNDPETGRPRQGLKSVWVYDDKHIVATQQVEIIPGEQSRLLDTCLVRYVIENQDNINHTAGLRFMLDTFIGANDGVPFTVPGEKGLCDTMQEFNGPSAIPDFLEALEHDDLRNPGTVAHLHLKLGGPIPPPSRVTLGAWPNQELTKRNLASGAMAQLTGWDVPVLSMKTLFNLDPRHNLPDSCVVIYWQDQLLPPGAKREVGFTYGLGNVASGEGQGQLGLSMDGSFAPGGEFTVTAYVTEPAAGQTVTLLLPEGFQLLEGSATQVVPPLAPEANSRNSPVTWKVRAPAQEGDYVLKVQSSTGVSQTQPVTIRSQRIFD
ncbi:MAG: hypothetical protein JO112_01250, partial [Planctomycetes bacterium]|nr:hypothetical protein [Planctomycetota bacterium]